MVISIRKRMLVGYLPWIIFRGIIAFGLLICGVVFTVNQLKGDIFESMNLHEDEDMVKGIRIGFDVIEKKGNRNVLNSIRSRTRQINTK
jgi:hypothetical protein